MTSFTSEGIAVCSSSVTVFTVMFCCSSAFFKSARPTGSWLSADFSPWPLVTQMRGDVAWVTLMIADVNASSPLNAFTRGSEPIDIAE